MPTFDALLAAFCVGLALLVFTLKIINDSNYTRAPVIGPPRTLFAWATNSFRAFNVSWGQEGFRKYMTKSSNVADRTRPFRVPASYGYCTVLPPELLQEYSRMGSDKVDFMAPPRDHMFFKYTVTLVANESEYHAQVVRTLLKRQLSASSKMAATEIERGLKMAHGLPKEWKTESLAAIVTSVVARSTSSFLVGSSLCRNEDYIGICIRYAMEMEASASRVRSLHPFLRPFLGHYHCRELAALRKEAQVHLEPLISEGQEKVNDAATSALGWLSEKLRGSSEGAVERQVARILFLNVISIFTISMASLNVLYDILSRPDVMAEIRKEIQAAQASQHSKDLASIPFNMLHKLDSCIRESQRLNPTNWIILEGKAVQDLKFSNGIRIKKGTYMSMPGGAILQSKATSPTDALQDAADSAYTSSSEFDAFRFVCRDEPDADNAQSNLNGAASISATNISFGYGRMSCPGRYFAVNSIKALVAGLLSQYDVELQSNGTGATSRPKNIHVGNVIIPDPTVMVKYRPVS